MSLLETLNVWLAKGMACTLYAWVTWRWCAHIWANEGRAKVRYKAWGELFDVSWVIYCVAAFGFLAICGTLAI